MNGNGMFFDSMDGDRIYSAADFREWLHTLFSEGVTINDFYTTADGGMSLNVTGGYTHIRGACKTFTEDTHLTLAKADAAQPRIDIVVLELDIPAKDITIKTITGTPAEEPALPVLVRTGSVWQLCLAEICVAAGITEITQDLIEDTRIDIDKCGYLIRSACDNDMSEVVAAYRGRLAQIVDDTQGAFEKWFSVQKAIFSPNMQEEIDALIQQMKTQQSTVTGIFNGYDSDINRIDQKIQNVGGEGGAAAYRRVVTMHRTSTTTWTCPLRGPSSSSLYLPTFLITQVWVKASVANSIGSSINLTWAPSKMLNSNLIINVVLSRIGATYRGAFASICYDASTTYQADVSGVLEFDYAVNTTESNLTLTLRNDVFTASRLDVTKTTSSAYADNAVDAFRYSNASGNYSGDNVIVCSPIIAVFSSL